MTSSGRRRGFPDGLDCGARMLLVAVLSIVD